MTARTHLVVACWIVIAGGPSIATAQSAVDGFDPGANGLVRTVAVQADGQILVGGDFSTLGGGGIGTTTRNRIGRLNADGSLDFSFDPGANGLVRTLAVQPDGKILIGGLFTTLGGGGTGATPRNYLGRLNADGTLDATFDPGANNSVETLAVQSDGKILVGGFFTALGGGGTGATPRNHLGRLNADGSLDISFDPGANNTVEGLVVQPDGKILVGGAFTTLGGGGTGTTIRHSLGRLNADGSLDATFDPGANNFVFVLARQADGKILVGGAFTTLGGGGSGTETHNSLGRLNADGLPDASFHPSANGSVYALVAQPDGKVLVGGTFTTLGDGTGATTGNHLGRINADGSLDSSFNPGANGNVLVLAVQPDGKILVGGDFMMLGGGGTGTTTRNRLGRLVASAWRSVWSEEFNGAANTGVDTQEWLYDTGIGYPGGPAQWGTGEVETMSGSTANVYQDGAGHLVIKPIHTGTSASSGWTSGRIETQRIFTVPPNGALAIEASIQQPNVSGPAAAGYWPAFWLLGAPFRGNYQNWPDVGEIDILEDINGLSSEFATFHCGTAPGGPCNEFTGISSGQRNCVGCQTAFHTYRVELDKSVSPQQIRWYLDGVNFFTVSSTQVDATTWSHATDHGLFIIFDVAMGGGFPNAFGGGPTNATLSGVPMMVDYLRVYTRPTAASAPDDFDGDGKADLTVYRPSAGGWYSLQSGTSNTTYSSRTWGANTDVPVPGDYDGDGQADIAVYRPAMGGWYILTSSTNYNPASSISVGWGMSTDTPVPGDYDGDGKTDIAVYRPSTGGWYILLSSTGYATSMSRMWGVSSDLPVPGDYDGDGKTDIAVYRRDMGGWYILTSSTSFSYASSLNFAFGAAADVPVPGDYDGDGKADIAVYRPSAGGWYILTSGNGYASYLSLALGGSTDVPVPGDYDGDGKTDIGIYRPSMGTWYTLTSSTAYASGFNVSWGVSTDTPQGNGLVAYAIANVPSDARRGSDFDGDRKADLTVYRPSTGGWYSLLSSSYNYASSLSIGWGDSTDVPVPGDYDGDGKTDIAVYRPSTGGWYILTSSSHYTYGSTLSVGWGVSTDVPVPSDYDGDGKTDIAVYRPSTGGWYILTSSTNYNPASSISVGWGVSTDVPIPGDYDGDGRTDIAVYRPSMGGWYILTSSTNYNYGSTLSVGWGVSTDVPIPGDYDGDGRTDIAVYRPSTGGWYVLPSSADYAYASSLSIGWGVSTDVPVPGDYDGDGKTDIGVYRPSTGGWYVLLSSTNYTYAGSLSIGWGESTDVPVLKRP